MVCLETIPLILVATWLTVVSWLGRPISTSHSTIGAVIGYGFVGGIGKINWQSTDTIFLGWLLSPLIGFASCYLIVNASVLTMKSFFSRLWQYWIAKWSIMYR